MTKSEAKRDAESSTDAGQSAAEMLSQLLQRLEQDPGAIEEYKLETRFAALRHVISERGETPPDALEAELIAFLLARAGETNTAWGLYFGTSWQTTALERITPETISYWTQRAQATPHSVMKARYADLVWELPKSDKIDGVRPDPIMGRLAVDAYIEAIERRRYKHDVTTAENGRRALGIACELRDTARIIQARDALLALDQAIAKDDYPGLWVGFDTFVEPPPTKHVSVTEEQRGGLVADMEARLARLAAAAPNEYHPSSAEAAALRLASHYRRAGQQKDIARVLRTYTGVVHNMRGTAAPLVAEHSLSALYRQLKTFGLHEDADNLNEAIRIAGEESLKDLKEISVEVPAIPEEQLEAYFAEMLIGGSEKAITRVAVHFIPDRSKVESELRKLVEMAPISFMLPHAIMDHNGRTVAHVGPLDSDLEGNVIRYIDQNLRLGMGWLRETMRRGFQQGIFSDTALLDFLLASPLFKEERRSILQLGLAAYSRGDSVSAIHVLLPQIEAGLRELAVCINAPLFTQRRGGGFHTRLLDEFLRDAAIVGVLGESAATYLRALLTDQRGWNIRNNISHGLAPSGMMTMPVADRVVHALLMLGCIHNSDERTAGSDLAVT